MNKPNFFIIGGPKCGTTALSEYLRTHPKVHMSTPKEPHFFATDFPRHRAVNTWGAYLGLFEGANADCKAIGEASVFYMYSTEAVSKIRQKFPDAKLIVLLRNPLELAISMHSKALICRDETVTSFNEAWRLCDERRQGRCIPKHCRDVKVLLYDDIAQLGRQLERTLNQFPRNQVAWWFFDDFRTEPGKIYREVLEFLGLRDDGRRSFPRVNARLRARSQRLAQFTQKPPRILVRTAMRAKMLMRIRRFGVLEALRSANFAVSEIAPLPQVLRRDMCMAFEDDVRLLAKLTDRDLSYWLQ